jgi:hypothetical protein
MLVVGGGRAALRVRYISGQLCACSGEEKALAAAAFYAFLRCCSIPIQRTFLCALRLKPAPKKKKRGEKREKREASGWVMAQKIDNIKVYRTT